MMQKKSELTPMDIKLLGYKDLWLKYLSMCEVDYYNDERMRLEYLCNLILDDMMRPEYKQVNLNVFSHAKKRGAASNTPTFEEIMEALDKAIDKGENK
jgi:hypothetical protein